MRRAAIALATMVLASCTSLLESDDVNVRLHNLSGTGFDSVSVQFPQETRRYGALAAGQRSAYMAVSQAYRYARIEAWVGGESHVLQPIDFVGEHLLPAGDHTYGLTFGGSPPRLGIVMADSYAQSGGMLFLVAARPASESMQALFEGRVIVDHAGCLRLDSPEGHTVVWPFGFTASFQGARVVVRNGSGQEVGPVGARFRLSGGEVTEPGGALGDGVREDAVRRCPGRFWIVGDAG